MRDSTQKNMTDMASHVADLIDKNEVKMTPAWHFTVRSILFMAGLVLVFGIVLYLVSLILFIITSNALHELPFFGFPGMMLFASSLPWLLILLALVLVASLEFFSSHLKLVYQRPLVYSSLALLIIVIGGGTLLARTTINTHLYALSQSGRLPLSGMYGGYVARAPGRSHIGQVSNITQENFTLTNREGKEQTLSYSEETKMPPRFTLKDGAMVMVLIEERDSITAVGIRPLRREGLLPPKGAREHAVKKTRERLPL